MGFKPHLYKFWPIASSTDEMKLDYMCSAVVRVVVRVVVFLWYGCGAVFVVAVVPFFRVVVMSAVPWCHGFVMLCCCGTAMKLNVSVDVFEY